MPKRIDEFAFFTFQTAVTLKKASYSLPVDKHCMKWAEVKDGYPSKSAATYNMSRQNRYESNKFEAMRAINEAVAGFDVMVAEVGINFVMKRYCIPVLCGQTCNVMQK
eukprot:1159205-Pelagomonas_calceolata.AAC.4